MATHSFADHLTANKNFHAACLELRALIEQGITPETAFDLIIRAYTNPLVRKFYAPVLHAWAMKLTPPTPEPVRTYQEEYTSALERIAVLEQELEENKQALQAVQLSASIPSPPPQSGLENDNQPTEEKNGQQENQVPEFYQLTLPGGKLLYLSLEQFVALLDRVAQEFLVPEPTS